MNFWRESFVDIMKLDHLIVFFKKVKYFS